MTHGFTPVTIGNATLFLGDCLEVLAALEPNSIDSVVTDPPYGIRFMGKEWDGKDIEATVRRKSRKETCRPDGWKRHDGAAFAAGTYNLSPSANRAFQDWVAEWTAQCLRVVKPGGHLLAFGSPRTCHRLASGIEDSGFEIRDQIMWLFGSGFPKSHNLEGEWNGWGTALKPAHEPIVVARKPLIGTVAENVQRYGTGALNIDGCRVVTDDLLRVGAGGLFSHIRDDKPYPNTRAGEVSAERRYHDAGGTDFAMTPGPRGGSPCGRWPANVTHDGSEEVLAAFPNAPGQSGAVTGGEPSSKTNNVYGQFDGRPATRPRGDSGSAARFFYCAKASKRDRDEGCDALPARDAAEMVDRTPGSAGMASPRAGAGRTSGARNHHPTVKPTALMLYLCRLVTPPGGTILDPFTGSGSTGKAALLEGFRFVGIEREPDYFEIAKTRIGHAADTSAFESRSVVETAKQEEAQQDLFSFTAA